MPTVLRDGPYRFFFYSGDGLEPPHVHVERDDCTAKFWIDPVRLQRNDGFKGNEISKIQKIIEVNAVDLLRNWNEYFNA